MKLSFFLAFFWSISAFGQETYTVSGFVLDSASHERLVGASVYLEGTAIGTGTNAYGFYSLTVPAGEYSLVTSHMGYKTETTSIDLVKGNVDIDIMLAEGGLQLDEVEVSVRTPASQTADMSSIRLSQKEIESIPAFLGEVDVLKAIQLLPGVQSGNEGTSGLYVRGGSPDQNLILLDGVPVYNASHLFGFFSVFNADAIKNVQLTKGGFPARFGGRLSSVVEIDLKEGNLKEFHGEGSLGLISSKLTLEGPIVKDKTSFLISGRRTYYDLIAGLFMPPDNSIRYYFGDANLKLNHIFSRKDRLYLSLYGGVDQFSNNETVVENFRSQKLRWGNRTGSLRWNHLYGDRLFSNLTATYSRYELGSGQRLELRDNSGRPISSDGLQNNSLIEDLGLKYDFDFSWNARHNLRFGMNYTYHTFEPAVAQINGDFSEKVADSLLVASEPVSAHEQYFYVEDDWIINQRWRANYGLHYSFYITGNTGYDLLQPRLAVRYLLSDNWSLKASYALMNQYVHLLSNTGFGLPTDLWVSSTANIEPQLSQQLALGTTKELHQGRYEFSAEAYYKWMQHLIAYKEGVTFQYSTNWEEAVETDGLGWSYGLELLARKKKGDLTGWLGYTLAWSNRQFKNINNGKVFPFRYDRRHDISLVANYKINEKVSLGGTWVFSTGNAFTSPLAAYTLNDILEYERNTVFQYSERNALRFPSYHRLDLGINFHKKTKWGKRIWNLSLYNAYSRSNPYYIYADENPETKEVEVYQVSIFPIIPSVSYIFKF